MNFDSHTSDVVATAIALINEVTPGQRHGREHPAPADGELVEVTERALPPPRSAADALPGPEQAAKLASWAARLRRVVELVDENDVDAACIALNEIMREVRAMPVLSRHDGESWHLHFHDPAADWATGWAAPMATALAVVLGNPTVDRLGICNAPACDRAYIDVSRNGTRRFCSTACQNRVKAATFRARRTSPPPRS